MAEIPSEQKVPCQFPEGLRVLAIDNDATVLENIKQMCIQCHYRVITCSESPRALNLVRERKCYFDVILMEVHMPNMDGYEFLQHVSKEINAPVIMMSVDDAKSSVMKAVHHGACDYWIKPLREDQFKNMWTHVARKAFSEENKIQKNSEIASSDDADESEHCSPPQRKKARVIWSPELHREFVKAVTQIGLHNAVPKRILEVMNVPGLTRENVSSHLQKYRHFLKNRSDEGTQLQQNEMPLPNPVQGTRESRVGASGRLDFPALAASSHVPYEKLAALHPELKSNLMPKEDHIVPTVQWPNHSHAEQGMTYGHPVAKCPSTIIIAKKLSQPIMDPSRYGVWPPVNTVVVNNSIQRNNALMDTLQQQRQQSLMHHQIRPINFQPSSMNISGNKASVTQICSSGRNIDYALLSPQSSNSPSVQIHGRDNRGKGIFNEYTIPASFIQQFQNSALTSGATRSLPSSSVSDTQVPYGFRPGDSLYQQSPKSLGDGVKDASIPTRSAGLKIRSSPSSSSNQNPSIDIDNNTIKEELNSMNSPEEDHTVS